MTGRDGCNAQPESYVLGRPGFRGRLCSLRGDTICFEVKLDDDRIIVDAGSDLRRMHQASVPVRIFTSSCDDAPPAAWLSFPKPALPVAGSFPAPGARTRSSTKPPSTDTRPMGRSPIAEPGQRESLEPPGRAGLKAHNSEWSNCPRAPEPKRERIGTEHQTSRPCGSGGRTRRASATSWRCRSPVRSRPGNA
jgi:hypothetical protein